ncbi:hypothetical protein [Cohnella yongneupensis]|uniref:Uncharacterized protein n=1 Tax=Cohnella yongneupensis TaxID=425006 RepID=A0ABW0QTV1_9BACL
MKKSPKAYWIIITMAAVLLIIIFKMNNKTSEKSLVNHFQEHREQFNNIAQRIKGTEYIENFVIDDSGEVGQQLPLEAKKLGLYQITEVKDEGIFFTYDTYFGFSKGYYYSFNDSAPQSSYITETNEIESDWYIYKMK